MKTTIAAAFLGMAALSLQNCNSLSTAQTNSPSVAVSLPSAMQNNPFLQPSTLQYQAPAFDKIKDSDFKPAFDYGLKVHSAEIQAIADNPAPATFDNTLVALEKSGQILKRATTLFYNLTGSNTNPALQAIEKEYAPIFSAHSDEMYLNDRLWQRIKAIDGGKLTGEDAKLLEFYRTNFEIAGADLNAGQKSELKKINGQLASLSTEYGNKLLDARKAGAVVFDNASELNGLSADELAAAKADAQTAGLSSKYLINLQNTTQQPVLQNLTNRAARERIFRASWTRAEKGDANDTRALVEQMATLRLQKAQLMGKRSFAEWKLQDQMARTPDRAENLLANLAKPAVEAARKELAEIQAMVDAEKGGFQVQPWDWNYYAEKVRKAKYDLDENEIRPYFEVTTVLEKGVFFAAEKFYGITFKKRPDLPVYNPDVVAYEVFDRDGKSIALYYLDFYTRSNKNGGAWMNNLVDQSYLLNQKPVIVNVFNYQKPAPGKPSLLSYDDVSTMFHEFGHTLHGLFASQKYPSLSGTSVPRDFVEFPSQINEYFALEPEVLRNYALHYQTRQPMPESLVRKIKNAGNFNQGYSTTELVSAASLDMGWHSVENTAALRPALEMEQGILKNYGFTLAAVPPRYHSPYFAHIWGGGYSAGYYAYMWSDMLNAQAWENIVKNGGMTRANGDRFRKEILSVGNSVDLNTAFRNFTGAEPTIDALLRSKGFAK